MLKRFSFIQVDAVILSILLDNCHSNFYNLGLSNIYMAKIFIVLVLTALLMFAACSSSSVQLSPSKPVAQEPVAPVIVEKASEPVVVQEEPIEEKVAGVPDARSLEPSACTNDIPSHRVSHVTLDVVSDPLRRTDEGFYLKLFPRDENEDVVPATVSVSVHIFRTNILQDPGKAPRREKDGTEVYLDSFYRKIENVGTDCAPSDLFIPFNRYNQDLLLKWADDDPGFVLVKTKIGSQEFQTTYNPHEKGESVRPPQ